MGLGRRWERKAQRYSVQGSGAPPTLGLQYPVAVADRARQTLAVPAAAPRRGWLRGAEVAGAELPPGLCLVSLPAQSLALGWGLALSARLRL